MKRICRNLSICVIVAVVITTAICFRIFVHKSKDKSVYATSINFTTTARGFEFYIENELLLSSHLINFKPANCSFKPQFTIKKIGEEEQLITSNKYKFTKTGKHLLKCKIKSSKDYYITDTISIMVVDNPTETTSMYIKLLDLPSFYVEDKIELSTLATISAPLNTELDLKCSEHMSVDNNTITMLKEGVGNLEIHLTYDSITIIKTISRIINPKIEHSDIDLILTFRGSVVVNNQLEIAYSERSKQIGCEVVNAGNSQTVRCWTDSPNIELLGEYFETIIQINTISVGNAILYISPIDYPSVVFEVFITIV